MLGSAVANERLQLVLGYVREFADLIREYFKQAQLWRPGMLATPRGPGRSPPPMLRRLLAAALTTS
jgi:hypothetical protein